MDTQIKQNNDQVVDLKELLIQVWRHRWYIVKITSIFLFIGFVIAISIPREFTSGVKMIPEEAKSIISGNMSDLAAMAGINIGTAKADGINLTLYPDVVRSTPFIAELIDIEIKGNELDYNGKLYNYLNKKIRRPWWGSVFSAPFKLIHLIRHRKDRDVDNKAINPYNLTIEQDQVFNALKERLSISMDKKTGTLSIGVTMQDPAIAALVADSLVKKLERFVIDYRTNKAKQDLDFAAKMFNDAKRKYYNAQKNYARYMDENKNIALESVRIEQERLRNEQALSYNVYTSLAQQLETSRMKVQEQTPCVTIIEPASIPVKKSNTSGLLILIAFCLWGALIGIIKIIYPILNKKQSVE